MDLYLSSQADHFPKCARTFVLFPCECFPPRKRTFILPPRKWGPKVIPPPSNNVAARSPMAPPLPSRNNPDHGLRPCAVAARLLISRPSEKKSALSLVVIDCEY